MGAGGSAQSRLADGVPSYRVTYKKQPRLLVLCTEFAEIRPEMPSDDCDEVIRISFFDAVSWGSSPTHFVFHLSKHRPGQSTKKSEIGVATLEAATIAASMGAQARNLQAKMLKSGVTDKEVRTEMKSQQEEFNIERITNFVKGRKLTSIQACWLMLTAEDRFVRLDTSCVVLPRLMHVSTLLWVVQQCFEDAGDCSNLQARLKGLMDADVIATLTPTPGSDAVHLG